MFIKVTKTSESDSVAASKTTANLRHGFDINFRVGILMEDGAMYSLDKRPL